MRPPQWTTLNDFETVCRALLEHLSDDAVITQCDYIFAHSLLFDETLRHIGRAFCIIASSVTYSEIRPNFANSAAEPDRQGEKPLSLPFPSTGPSDTGQTKFKTFLKSKNQANWWIKEMFGHVYSMEEEEEKHVSIFAVVCKV